MARVVAANVLLSCEMLYFHFYFGIALILWGLLALCSRIPLKVIQAKLRPWHGSIGQAWMYGMIVQISTSLFCRGDGFRLFIFGFLTICVTNMIIAHISIRVFQRRSHAEERAKLLKLLDLSSQQIPEAAGVQARSQTEDVPEAWAAQHAVSVEDPKATPCEVTGINPIHNIEGVYLISSRNLKLIHGIAMTLSFVMLFGAGVMFTRRSENLRTCKPLYSVRDTLDNMTSIIWEKDGVRYMGGATCIGGMRTDDVYYAP